MVLWALFTGSAPQLILRTYAPANRDKTFVCFTYRFFPFKAYVVFCSCNRDDGVTRRAPHSPIAFPEGSAGSPQLSFLCGSVMVTLRRWMNWFRCRTAYVQPFDFQLSIVATSRRLGNSISKHLIRIRHRVRLGDTGEQHKYADILDFILKIT